MPRLAWLTFAATVLLAAGVQAQTLERIRDSGTFRIGYREDAAPFSFKNTLGEPAGFSVELCRLVAAETKAALGLDRDHDRVRPGRRPRIASRRSRTAGSTSCAAPPR